MTVLLLPALGGDTFTMAGTGS